MNPGDRVTLTIEALPNHDHPMVPPEVRLRRLLKAMLRAYGFRVTDYRPANVAKDEPNPEMKGPSQ